MAYVTSGWDFARTGPFNLDAKVSTWGTASFADGTYAHVDLSSVMGSGAYDDFAGALKASLDVATGETTTVAFDAATGKYTLAGPSGFSLDFTFSATDAAETARMKALLGFTNAHPNMAASILSGATSYTSDIACSHWVELARDGVSGYSRPYVADGQTVREVSTDGSARAVRPSTREKRCKWTYRFQSLASVFADEAAASAPWTFEALYDHAWLVEPCLLHTSTIDAVFKHVSPDSFSEASRKPQWDDFHGKWNLPVEAQYLGSL